MEKDKEGARGPDADSWQDEEPFWSWCTGEHQLHIGSRPCRAGEHRKTAAGLSCSPPVLCPSPHWLHFMCMLSKGNVSSSGSEKSALIQERSTKPSGIGADTKGGTATLQRKGKEDSYLQKPPTPLSVMDLVIFLSLSCSLLCPVLCGVPNTWHGAAHSRCSVKVLEMRTLQRESKQRNGGMLLSYKLYLCSFQVWGL